MRRPTLAALFILIVSAVCIGQEGPKPVLIEEHGQLSCDHSLALLDAWYSELSKNPDSVGLAVIYSRPEEKHRGVFRLALMEWNARIRGASNVLRLKYVRAKSSEDLKIQLWRIPAGAEEPEIESVDNRFVLPSSVKPFMLGAVYSYEDGICPKGSSTRVFAEFLKGNPDARGNIVVRDRSIERANRAAKKIGKEFDKRYGIPSSRLRFFPRKSAVPANNLEPVVEYWYLP